MPEKKKRKFAVGPVLRVFWTHMRPYPLTLSIALGGAVLSVVVDVITPLYYKRFFDVIAGAVPSDDLIAHMLIGIMLTILGFKFLGWACRRSSNYAYSYAEPHIMNDLSQTAFSALLEHSYGYFVGNFTGSVVRRITRLSRAFEQFFDNILFNILPLLVSLGGIIIVLFLRNRLLGGVFLAWAITIIGLQFAIAKWKMVYSLRAAAKDSESTGVLSDSIGNDTTIKLFTGENAERSLFKKVSDELAQLRFFSWRFDEYVNGVQGLLMISIEFILVYTGIHLWQQGAITVGDFALIQSYLVAAIGQLWNFGSNLRRMYEAFADATEMIDVMNLPREIVDVPNADTLAAHDGKIEFKQVQFGFADGAPVLSDFNLAIRPHQSIALVGPSGAGKSTITKLILRFYDVTGGSIEIDGQDIATVTQDSLRASIAFVPQEPILFHRTLMENIRYGRRTATDQEVIEAAKQAHCYDFIMRTKDGFETFVGERGIKLSGGERQRVAIARAILKDAPILILDEATSSLDSESEALIQDALEKLMNGKTVIAIAHRLSTVMKMDRIIVVEGGKVAMDGTHDELVRHEGGLYQKLWDIQAGGFLSNDSGEPVPAEDEDGG